MSVNGWLQIALVFALVLARPLGLYAARVMGGDNTALTPMLRPLETGFYRLAGVDPARELVRERIEPGEQPSLMIR